MKKANVYRSILVIGALICLANPAAAATLRAKVVEVQSGNSVLVTNTNRPVRVRLKAIAPPEAGQPFSAVAREHLQALVFDKAVVVEYSSMTSDYLEGRVVADGIDIGSQMLRDGVAWYDRSTDYGLTEADRVLYAQCEQAARAEKRGLWSEVNPVAPWEFRREQNAKLNPVENAATAKPPIRPRLNTGSLAFSNVDLVGGAIGPGSVAGNPTLAPVAPHAAADQWVLFSSQSPRFSIRVPGNSYKYEYPVLDGEKKVIKFNYVIGSSEEGIFTVMWANGSNDNATDALVADGTVQGLIKGVNQALQAKGLGVQAVAGAGTYVRVGAYTGKQYPISAGALTGLARIVSRQVGTQRELFAIAWFTEQGSDNGATFLSSLKIASDH
jgi:endonuclease YncB( thermonuclease family)